jgi:phage shock protein A
MGNTSAAAPFAAGELRKEAVDAARRSGELHEIDLGVLLERAEDPSEMLGYTAAERQELLTRVRQAISDVAASRERAQLRERRLRRSADRLQEQAWQALAAGRDDHARQVMAWQATIRLHITELNAEQAALHASQERLSVLAGELQEDMAAISPPGKRTVPDSAGVH